MTKFDFASASDRFATGKERQRIDDDGVVSWFPGTEAVK